MDAELVVVGTKRRAHAAAEYDTWLAELRRYVHRLTGDPDMSDDVAQDAIVRYIRAQESGAVHEPRAWLYRAATNIVRDHARHEAMKQRRQPVIELEQHETPEDDVVRMETIRGVRNALDRIPPRDRELLLLRESGFRHAEIAAIIGVKTESVSTLAARALERFRVAYAGGAQR